MSGLTNFHECKLNNGLENSPIVHVKIHTDRGDLRGNFITLGIPQALRVTGSLATVSSYVNERLQGLGAELVRFRLPSYSNEVFAGRAVAGDPIPYNIKVSNYLHARRVIDDLFAHNEMSATNRSEIEGALRELERSGEYASKGSNEISVAQKDILINMVEDYVETIKSAAPNNETAKSWLRCAARALSICGPSVKNNMKSSLWTACKSGHDKDADFYEDLFALARIYSLMGDLERAFEQMGSSLPSKEIVRQTICDVFDQE